MTKNQIVEGKVFVTGKGVGYLKSPLLEEDIEIQPLDLKKAFHNDIVEVQIKKQTDSERPQGIVLKIIKRVDKLYVGTVIDIKENYLIVKPDNKHFYSDFKVQKNNNEAKFNDKVSVSFISWEDNEELPLFKLEEIIGPKGVHEVEMKAIVIETGFDLNFDQALEKEAQEMKLKWDPIPQEEIAKRKDMRGTLTITIDPETAKDFDDALSFKKLEDGNYEIGIHIADVSHFVKPGTLIDEEAADRAFSVYLVDRTIPMLPEILSNDLCSLNPHEDKLAFSAIFKISREAKIIESWYGRTIIHSNHRFSYEEAENIIKDPESNTANPEITETLKTLQEIADKLTKEKIAGGAIRFEKDEFAFELDKNGVPMRIYKKPHLDSHRLIEEFMLLANRNVAKFIYDKNKKLTNGNGLTGLVYRNHGVPDKDKVNELAHLLNALDYKLTLNDEGEVTPKELNRLLSEVVGKPEESLVTTAAIRTMSKAIYAPHNTGHFGLAFEYYTHFTSPIRRYPDLLVHRILEKLLNNEAITDRESNYFEKMSLHSTNQEIAAAEAERNSIKYKQVEFMINHIGEEFEGIISGVSKYGVFVVLDDTGAEGMIHISKLGTDFFELDEKNYRVIGRKTNQKFTLGDKIRVRILEANMEERKLDMMRVG